MKLIFVTQRIDEAVSYAERRDALDQRWAVLLEKLGCAALPVPNHTKTAAGEMRRNAMKRTRGSSNTAWTAAFRCSASAGGCSRFCFISAARSNAYRAMWPYVTTFREQSAELSTATIIGAPGRRLQS